MKPVILASGSPRRKELLALTGVSYTVKVSDVDETTDLTDPTEIVKELSKRKAMAVATSESDALVIGSDTIVSLNGEIMGKPVDRSDAKRMLCELSGKTHQVASGVSIVEMENGTVKKLVTFAEVTDVLVRELTDDEIDVYCATGECDDKAGAYGIQGRFAIFIDGIRGDYYNVVGLPIARLYQELKDFK